MRGEIPVQYASFVAGADLSAAQYKAVKVDANGHIVLAGAGDNAIGILQEGVPSGVIGRVMLVGESYAVYGAQVTAGQNLAVDAAGNLIPAVGTACVIGVATESGANATIHSVALMTRVASGTGVSYPILCFPVALVNLDDAKVLTDYVPGFAGRIKKMSFVTLVPTTDVANSNCVISLAIGAVAVTGGVVTLDVDVDAADPDTAGMVIEGTEVTDKNVFTATDKLNIAVANTANAFADGSGVLILVLEG